MSNFLFPVYDGVAPSWADFGLRISGQNISILEVGDVAACNLAWSLEAGEQREGGRVIKTTTGSVSCEGSLTLYADGWRKLVRAFLQAAPRNAKGQAQIALVHFEIHRLWTPPGSTDLLEDKGKGCRIFGRTIDASEGDDAQQVEIPLNVKEVVDIVDGVEVLAI